MNWNSDHLPAFVAVATHGGISAAARIMGQPKSSLSRIINRLEEDDKTSDVDSVESALTLLQSFLSEDNDSG